VYQVCTEAQHMAEWWGPAKLSLPVCEMDVRPGGTYRFVQRDDDGTEYPFRGEFREVVAPSRLVMTQIFEPYADHEMLVTLTFEDLGNGRTRLTDHMRFDTIESRDATLAAGMESGARESYDRMAALLARLSS
ncbi:MAG: SRPBCC family protein, partial [Chloroflexi bacterium]|nr:SRPBCC family protein [Chloroflexota bacterium]